MPPNELDKGSIPFQTEGRLLQELGLRLVASPEVALVELIKNAYDADAPTCTVRVEEDNKVLVVADEGHGMTISDFKTKWMRIATSSKVKEETSPKYHRRLTGAKGIGRFAVRYLGDHLTLESVAFDKHHECLTRLKAVFDWPKLDAAHDISKSTVEYSLVRVPEGTPTGTALTVRKLTSTTDFTTSSELKTNVLRIVSPIHALKRGKFANAAQGDKHDPGFQVILPGSDGLKKADIDLATLVLDNYWARLTVELQGRELTIEVSFPGQKKPRTLAIRVNSAISKGFFADIRFFPRRKGVFQGKGINGRKAWAWVRENCGVAVVDHGFRMKPYGFRNDDWLWLDRDKAHSARDWVTKIAQTHFAIPEAIRVSEKDNPALNLPYNFQLVGAVFLESKPASVSKTETDLVPSMDREGFLKNAGFEQLREYVRAGIEFLAHEDKAELQRIAEAKAREAARSAREDIRKAIEFIQKSTTLLPGDKARIVKQYRDLADKLEEQEEYSTQARRNLLTMSLLGVVAGFMTHESKAIVHDLEQAVHQVQRLAKKHPELRDTSADLEHRLKNFQDHLEYTRMFVQKVRSPNDQPLSAAGQVRYILKRFDTFAKEHGVVSTNDITAKVMTPPLPVTAYSGILLNLYTNALKAVIAVPSSINEPRISFRAWNEKGKHIVEVVDNGVGIPPEIQKRIWEPLYTTTSDVGNPLGSGMGLGLTLVKQVVNELGGSISLGEAPPGFTTCFRVAFPNP